MADEQTTRRRFRLRFSVRTLLVLVTVVALYFGSWQATEQLGATPMRTNEISIIEVPSGDSPRLFSEDLTAVDVKATFPFVIRCDFPALMVMDEDKRIAYHTVHERGYYFWFFGRKPRLIRESVWAPTTTYLN